MRTEPTEFLIFSWFITADAQARRQLYRRHKH